MSDSRPLLEAHQLCKRYGDFALRNVDLTVRPGEIVGYVGRNGAGKTTTIKSLLGLIRPDGGEGTVMGAPIREMGRSEGVAAKDCWALSSTRWRSPMRCASGTSTGCSSAVTGSGTNAGSVHT